MTTFIYAYSPASSSAKKLAEAMQIKRLKHNPRRERRFSEEDTIINWGATQPTRNFNSAIVFNKPTNVSLAAHKLNTYDLLKTNNIKTVEYTKNKEKALEWLRNDHTIVFGRNTETSHGGQGITVYDPTYTNEIEEHKFYTKYWPHTYELRLHAIFNNIVHIQRKLRTNNTIITNPQYRVRNHANGYVFTSNPERLEINLEPAKNLCKAALTTLGLDFGAFDVLVRRNGESCILECNTAPGIEGTTVILYANTFLLNS